MKEVRGTDGTNTLFAAFPALGDARVVPVADDCAMALPVPRLVAVSVADLVRLSRRVADGDILALSFLVRRPRSRSEKLMGTFPARRAFFLNWRIGKGRSACQMSPHATR